MQQLLFPIKIRAPAFFGQQQPSILVIFTWPYENCLLISNMNRIEKGTVLVRIYKKKRSFSSLFISWTFRSTCCSDRRLGQPLYWIHYAITARLQGRFAMGSRLPAGSPPGSAGRRRSRIDSAAAAVGRIHGGHGQPPVFEPNPHDGIHTSGQWAGESLR